MKNSVLMLVIAGFLLIANSGYSQLQQRDRMGRGNMSPTDIPAKGKKPMDPVEASIKNLDKELTLDDFQKAAIGVTMRENRSSMEEIAVSSTTDEEKKEKMQLIRDKIYKGIMDVLNKDQKVKYAKLVEDADKKALKR